MEPAVEAASTPQESSNEAGQESSRNIDEGRDGINNEAGMAEGHVDLDAYRTSRRLSRPNSRLRHSFSRARSEGESSTSPQMDTKQPNNDNKHDGAPLCLVAYTHRIESCTQSIQAWSDRQEEKTRSKRDRKANAGVIVQDDGVVIEPKGDSWLQSNIIIFVVVIILFWIYIVFVWRICVAGIRNESRALITRTEGIGLLVGFHILWLITIWTYVRVVMSPPGYVRDYVAISDPPAPPEDVYDKTPILYPTIEAATGEEQNSSTHQVIESDISDRVDRGEETVDPSLPAVIGPLGAGQVAKADEEKVVVSQQNNAITPWTENPTYNNNERYVVPEPVRGPTSQVPPLYPNNLYCYRCKRVKPPRAHHCRHCATCVLQMDHHCPWVGGCVGARNHKYFYHFLQWVTTLEYFVLIVNAIVFNRGIKRRAAGAVPGWSIDGYMISIFPICFMFILFTTALLITHSYLFMLNLTTIEHLAYDRMQTREEILLSNYLDARRDFNGEKLKFIERLKEKKRVKANWIEQWGNLKSEANVWWLDDQEKSKRREGKKTTWYQSIGPNWKQHVGDAWYQSFFPIGRAKSDGLSYEMNWRFAEDGTWKPRTRWQQAKKE